MYVAITAEKDNVQSLVPRKFRDAKVLMIIDADTNMLSQVFTKEDEDNLSFARHIIEQDCEVLITGEIEREAFEIIAGANITRYDGSTKKVQRAYDYFCRGQLTLIRDYINGPGAIGHTHDFSCDCGVKEKDPEETDMVFDAVITAAGLSSRMGEFKPLMKLGGRINLIRQMETLYEAGVRHITVVVGYRKEEIQQVLETVFEEGRYRLVENPDYASTQMFDSIKMGIEDSLMSAQTRGDSRSEGIFYVPVDIPLFTVHTIESLMDHFSYGTQNVFQPVFEGEKGHPLLIRNSILEHILEGDASEGLRSALNQDLVVVASTEVPDRGILLDADTPEEYKILEQEVMNRQQPDDSTCYAILQWAGVTDEGFRHAEAVAAAADEICEKCKVSDGQIHPSRIHSAALLHDVLWVMDHHDIRGGQLLRNLDMPEIGSLIETHHDMPDELLDELNDHLILFLADKMVAVDQRVTVEERFQRKREKFTGNPVALKHLERRYAMAKRALQTVQRYGWEEKTCEQEQ